MKMKRFAALALAACLAALAGCGGGETLSSSASSDGSAPASSQAQEGQGASESQGSPSGGETASQEVGLVMQVLEYHKEDGGYGCIAEIPRLEGTVPGLDEANAAVDALAAEWEEFKASEEHTGGFLLRQITCYPYSNGKWYQAVVRTITVPTYAYLGEMLSVNYDIENGRPVTVDEALEGFGLTREGLVEKLAASDLYALTFPEGLEITLEEAEVQAFRMREDGSGVFFLKARALMGNGDYYTTLLAWDSREDSFSGYREKLVGEEKPNPGDPPLAWENPDLELM